MAHSANVPTPHLASGLLPRGRRLRTLMVLSWLFASPASSAAYGDVQSPRVVTASVSARGEPANASCSTVSVSSDGNHVLFLTSASNLLDSGSETQAARLAIFDVRRGQIAWCLNTSAADGYPADIRSPWLSHDGSHLAFLEFRGQAQTPELESGRLRLFVCREDGSYAEALDDGEYDAKLPSAASSMAMSASGDVVALLHPAHPLDPSRGPGTITIISRKSKSVYCGSPRSESGDLFAAPFSPTLSADGQRLAFVAARVRPTVDAQSIPSTFHVFDFDTRLKRLDCVTARSDAAPGTGGGIDPSLSADGRLLLLRTSDHQLSRTLAGRRGVSILALRSVVDHGVVWQHVGTTGQTKEQLRVLSPRISGDGGHVIYYDQGDHSPTCPNLDAVHLLHCTVATGVVECIADVARMDAWEQLVASCDISFDGSVIAYMKQRSPAASNRESGVNDIVVRILDR